MVSTKTTLHHGTQHLRRFGVDALDLVFLFVPSPSILPAPIDDAYKVVPRDQSNVPPRLQNAADRKGLLLTHLVFFLNLCLVRWHLSFHANVPPGISGPRGSPRTPKLPRSLQKDLFAF